MSEHRGSLSKAIGNVKRKYDQNDFNPFTALEFVFDKCMMNGAGHTVLLVGWSERFQNDTLRALNHVMFSRKMIGGDDPVVQPDRTGDLTLDNGITLRFKSIPDNWQKHVEFKEQCDQADIIVLCSSYACPDMRNILREANATKLVYDVSTNNLG